MIANTNGKSGTVLKDEFISLRPFYEKNTEKFKALISTLIEQENINVHSVASRTKEIPSLTKKTSGRPDQYKQVSDVTDISGVRIICYFASEVDRVARLKALRRQFSCVAGILELADKEFDEIRTKIDNYSKEIAEKIRREPKEVTIDRISLNQYLRESGLIEEMDSRIADIRKSEIDKSMTGHELNFLLNLCNYYGINRRRHNRQHRAPLLRLRTHQGLRPGAPDPGPI